MNIKEFAETLTPELFYDLPFHETKRIIGGKTYNTETSTLLAEFDNSEAVEQCYHMLETLYQTKKGALFLVVFGQVISVWSQNDASSNNCFPGYGLIPISKDDAKNWLEIRNLTDDYQKIFGLPDEADSSDTPTRICFTTSPKTFKKVKEKASVDSLSVSSFLNQLVEKHC